MKHTGIIAWFVRNPVAANLLMVAIMAFGFFSVSKKIPLETFPAFELEVVNITVPYPGGTPYEVEQGIVTRVEDAIGDLPGVERIYSDGAEGAAQIRVEIRPRYDVTKVLNEIKTRLDGISTFPEGAERPVIEQLIRVRDVITLIVMQEDDDEVALRRMTEQVRDELRALPDVTQVAMGGIRPWEVTISVPEARLREYGLTLAQIAQAIRNSSRDIPGGTIKSGSGDILVRALGQAYRKADFADITVLGRANGTRIRLGDIATISDGFNEDPLYSSFDNKKAAFINVSRVGDQNAIKVANKVKEYVEERNETLPEGAQLTYWKDSSKIVKARLNTLTRSLLQGIALVLLLLALFLRPDLGFWVSMGIPISFLGALAMMPVLGVTLNLVSMFAFIVVLGIVVDDAIVTGENIYSHLQRDGDARRAAVEGTHEIAVPVTFGVLTTVAAFLPLLMIDGVRGKIFAQIPMIVIPVLLFSLIESKLILPAHLRHLKLRGDKDAGLLGRFQQKFSRGLEYFVDHFYRPFLEVTLNWRYLTIAVFIGVLLVSITLMTTGRYKYTFFPRIQSETVSATLQMPEGTPLETTLKYVDRIKHAAESMQKKYREPDTDEAVIQHILVTVGSAGRRPRENDKGVSHLASVTFETLPPEQRQSTITTRDMVKEWRRLIGPIPGARELAFRAELGRGGEPIDVQLAGNDFDELNSIAEQVMVKLQEYEGLFDIKNSYDSGKTEVQLKIRPEAEQLGLSMSDLGTQVRHAIYGAEAQRIQREQSEVKVMVRYPQQERYSFAALENLRIRTPSGSEMPLFEVADITVGQGLSKISRVDRRRVIHVTADIDKEKADANKIVADLKEWFPGVLDAHPGVAVDLEGEQREQKDFQKSLAFGFAVAMITIYVLLAIPFGSYFQPLMVMSVIPFSIIGALIGHSIMGMSLSISSMMGLLALIGVVVNDSLVLVDYTNKRVKEGMPLVKAVRHAGGARFRPILLTSLTTFAGLTPLLMEKSTQAQFLIPMAVSLGFGILFATFLTLILIPSLYLVAEDIKALSNTAVSKFA